VTQIVALLVFLITCFVYFTTLTPTVPFWDAGEFIAVSYILGIPHPPGTPFYVLLGRIFTLIPWHTVAERVNALSALSGALAVLFTYFTSFKLIRMVQTRASKGPAAAEVAATTASGSTTMDLVIAHVGAAIGSLMLAFSDSFWENSIEAEVYATMSFAQIFVFWLGLRWWEEHEKKPTAMPLLLATYVMWLSVGLHLGVAIMSIPLLALVWLVDRRVATVFLMPFLTSLLVTMGLERMAGGVLLLSTAAFAIYAYQGKLNGWVVAAAAVGAMFGMGVAFSDAEFGVPTLVVSALSILVPLVLLARRHREGRILALALFLMVAGYSTHLYLPIRAAQHPAVNEGDPSTWQNLKDLLERKQYGSKDMFAPDRPWAVQLDKEFWRYFRRQWPIFPTDRPWGGLLPILIGVAGGVWHFRREKISWISQFFFLGVTTAGMIVFLNFSAHEVRERDYFFQSGYHAFSIWIGMGVAFLIGWVADSFSAKAGQKWAAIATAVLLSLMPLLLLGNLWHTHDRRGNYVARDYAYNMLVPLADSSYVFTNGDNDTFPLWYIQQVEKVRPDVRVVNLSLLNTDWYIKQLRDEEPRVPIDLDDATIKLLGRGAVQDESGQILYTNQFMVRHIVEQSKLGENGWKKKPYFAVTVPSDGQMGLAPYFTLEGLVYRVNRDTLQGAIDVAATQKALYQTFKYRGLFTADGSWDSTVYKDENAATLSRNYAAAHLQLGFDYRKQGNLQKGIEEFERISRMFPDLAEVLIPLGGFYLERGDTAKAMALYQRLAERNPGDPEARYYYGVSLLYENRLEDAVRELEAAITADPNFNYAYYAAYYSLWEAGQRERALSFLERWLAMHPADQQTRALLAKQRSEIGGAPIPSNAPPPPPVPGLP
jgi:hypothetical protein